MSFNFTIWYYSIKGLLIVETLERPLKKKNRIKKKWVLEVIDVELKDNVVNIKNNRKN